MKTLRLLTVFALAGIASPLMATSIIVNEFFNGNGAVVSNMDNSEAFELLLTQDFTAAQLNGVHVGDSTGSTAAKFGNLVIGDLSSIASTFYAGTILVIGGATYTEDTAYTPMPGVNGADNSAWNLVLLAGGTYLTNAGGSNNIQIGGSGDVVWVDGNDTSTADFDIFHGVAWDASSPGAFHNAGGNVVAASSSFSTLVTGDFVAFTGGAADVLNPAAFIDNNSTGSLGDPNGGLNTTFVQTLRGGAVPEPGRASLLGLGLVLLMLRRRRHCSCGFPLAAA